MADTGINKMETESKTRHYKPFSLKKIARLRILGYFVLILGPLIFFYKQPENTPLLIFVEFLLILFGVVILKDCWVSQEYWQNKSEKR